jgi:hypothetical protein
MKEGPGMMTGGRETERGEGMRGGDPMRGLVLRRGMMT